MAEPPPPTTADADKTPAPLALPPSQPLPSDTTSNSSSGGEQGVRTIAVDGTSVKLDHLGPIIINTDGTVARISNWQELSEGERSVALRRIAKRNKARVQQLADGQDGGGAEEK